MEQQQLGLHELNVQIQQKTDELANIDRMSGLYPVLFNERAELIARRNKLLNRKATI